MSKRESRSFSRAFKLEAVRRIESALGEQVLDVAVAQGKAQVRCRSLAVTRSSPALRSRSGLIAVSCRFSSVSGGRRPPPSPDSPHHWGEGGRRCRIQAAEPVGRECQEFRVRAGMMGEEEIPDVPTQGTAHS